jgi:hypothetical protein
MIAIESWVTLHHMSEGTRIVRAKYSTDLALLLRLKHQRIFFAVKPLYGQNHWVLQGASRSLVRFYNCYLFQRFNGSAVLPFPSFLDTHHKSAIRNKYLTHEGRIPDAILIAG